MKFEVPESLGLEHKELHAELARAMTTGGRTAEHARTVANLLHQHFQKEEQYALPPLGLLAALAAGEIHPEMRGVLEMTDKLEVELPEMLAEHEAIVLALRELLDAAKRENKPEATQFAEKLMSHARMEEEVTYPAARLVGRYIKAVLPG